MGYGLIRSDVARLIGRFLGRLSAKDNLRVEGAHALEQTGWKFKKQIIYTN